MNLFGSVKRKCFDKFLKSLGCSDPINSKGDHIKYKCPNCKRPIVMRQTKEIPEFHIRTNLETLGIGINQFLKFKQENC